MSSEDSSITNGRQEYMLYRVFIHRCSEKNPPLNKEQIEEWFATLIEPFKVTIRRNEDYGFAYFGSKRDARACIAAFDNQPPFRYKVSIGQPEKSPMTDLDLKRLNLELEYKTKRLELINIQMRELRLEKSKLTNDLDALADYCSSDPEDLEERTSNTFKSRSNSRQNLYIRDAEDEEFRLDKQRMREKSRTRISEYFPEKRRDKSRPRISECSNQHDRSENRHSKPLLQNFNNTSERHSRYSMSTQQNENVSNKNKNTRHSIASTSDIRKTSSTQHATRMSSTNKENHYDSKQQFTTPNKKSFDKRECITKSLTLLHKGTLKLKTIFNSRSCVAQITIMGDDFSNYVQAIQNIWETYPTEYIEPIVGDLVCIENDKDEGWSRGYVIEKMNMNNEYRIGLIDDGVYVNNVTKCCKLLPEHVRIPDFATFCKVINVLCDEQKFLKLFSEDKTYSFIITAVGVDDITNRSYVKCTLKDRKTKENICEMKLFNWVNSTKNNSNETNSNANFMQSEAMNNQPSSYRNDKQKNGMVNHQNSYTNFKQTKVTNYQSRSNTNSNPNYKQTKDAIESQPRSNTNYGQSKVLKDPKSPVANIVNNQHSFMQTNTENNKQHDFTKYEGIIPEVNLPSESTVMIALVESQQTFYVKYRESTQHLKTVSELIRTSISKLIPMNRKCAKIGKCVAAQFSEDQAWYRAEILQMNNNTNLATVLYIDYGNKEEVDISETKMLSPPLIEIPRAVVKINLSNLLNKRLTLAQAKYIDECMESKTKFKMILNALNRNVLLMNGNENFNEKLLSLSNENLKEIEKEISKKIDNEKKSSSNLSEIISSSQSISEPSTSKLTATTINPIEVEEEISQKIDNEKKKTSNSSENISCSQSSSEPTTVDMLFADLPVGVKTTIIFQSVLEAKERVIVCYPDDVENLRDIQETLTKEIGQYLESNTEETSYKPDPGAACIAKYDGLWFRAICLDIQDNSASVMFVDFGNYETVNFTDIRRLPQKFAEKPAIALICTVEGIPLEVSEEEFSKLLEEMETYEVDVIEKQDSSQFKIYIHGIPACN